MWEPPQKRLSANLVLGVLVAVFAVTVFGYGAARPAVAGNAAAGGDNGPAGDSVNDFITPPLLRLSDSERVLTLIGTIHSVPRRYRDAEGARLPMELYDEIEAADLILVESNLLTLRPLERLLLSAEVRRAYMEANAEDGRPSLRAHLKARGESLPNEFARSLAERLDDVHDQRLGALLELRPWAARDRLNRLRRRADEYDWGAGLDEYIVRTAREAGTQVKHLETWEELALLMDEADQEYYVDELLFSVMGDIPEDEIVRARQAHSRRVLEYWSRDELETIMASPYDELDRELPPELQRGRRKEIEMLLETRERAWAPELLSILEETGAERVIVAVGAAHVRGDDTVFPELLLEAGFTPVSETRDRLQP